MKPALKRWLVDQGLRGSPRVVQWLINILGLRHA